MVSRIKRTPQRAMPASCCMILALLLVACGGGTTSTPTPTPQPSPTPSPTPTPGLTVYTGNGYSIGYPQGWKVTPNGIQVAFTDATDVYNLTIVVSPNPHGIVDASTVANTSIEAVKKTMKNPQTETLPPTTTVGGDSWVQKSITGTETSNGLSVDVQLVVISDNHPANSANTQNFTIIYATKKSLFASANTSYFQPMLQSFKFT
jgi:photosystem II reaction center protein PsbP